MALFVNDLIDETVDLNTSAKEAFALLKDIANWPNWVRGLKKSWAISEGDWRVGYKIGFLTNIAPLPLSPLVIQEYEEGRVIEWGSRSPIFTMGHRFEIIPVDEKRCHLRQREYSQGLLGYATLPLKGVIARFDRAWARDMQTYFAK